MKRDHLLISALILLCLTATVHAATINAASCSQSAVQSAINSAASGDTVVVPACGSTTWATPSSQTPAVIINKAITVQGQTTCTGAGATLSCTDNTTISDGTGTGWMEIPIEISSSNARLTGITFVGGRAGDSQAMVVTDRGTTGWRIDHCHFVPATPVRAISAHGYGLIDHSYFKDALDGVDVEGDQAGDTTYPGDVSWSQPMSFGTANAVYIEDNEFNYTQVLDGAYDAYAGARLVFRYNDVKGTNYGGHGLDSGGLRSTMQTEIYNNSHSNSGSAIYTLLNTRGGSYIVFNNTVSASGGSYNAFFILQNYRSDPGYSSSWGTCDGSNSIDQNSTGGHGWGCRDQVGRGTNQGSYPQYTWGNFYKGAAPVVGTDITVCGYQDCTAAQTYHVLNNRDFYNEVASFSGTAGVGSGLLSARPSTCTPRVAYWARDINTLYNCSATNTWNTYYTPYTYPHPLQGTTLAPPTNVSVTVQ